MYQYFPNKDSILLTLALAHLDEGTAVVRAGLTRVADGPVRLTEWLPVVVEGFTRLHADEPRLHRVLFEESPRPPELLDRFRLAEQEAVTAVAGLLRRDPDLDLPDPERTARIVVAVVESLVHRLVGQGGGEAEELTGEITTVVTGYLHAAARRRPVTDPPTLPHHRGPTAYNG
ncbi:hypothetical protein [Micromonospora sp. SH-82]|uniref:hypothetical protein n=1 Tax=Micromonospora sp. SH-82 TaxID=3132938 RepID=UPI003EBE29F3